MDRVEIARMLATEFGSLVGVTADEVMGPARTKTVSLVRFQAWAAARARYGWSFPEIGEAFGRDHTTIIYGVRKVTRTLDPVRKIRLAGGML